MDKKIKLWVGIALVGVAAYLILKPKTPKTTASTEPKCKDDEISSTKIVNGKETKVCESKYVQDHTAPREDYNVTCVDGTTDVSNGELLPCLSNGGVVGSTRVSTGGGKQNDDVQAEGFNGY
jgi:hypothetical protein